MLNRESLWFRQKLEHYLTGEDVVLNIGSNSLEFRERLQPCLELNLFAPLRERGVRVYHIDLKKQPGVDFAGDVTDPNFIRSLRKLRATAAICSNLLEHLQDRGAFARSVVDIVDGGSRIFASCPYAYPYHPDPIDTLFRPTVAELTAEFPQTVVLEGEIVRCGRLIGKSAYELSTNPTRWMYGCLRSWVRLAMPFWRPKRWVGAALAALTNPLQKISATCVVLEKRDVNAAFGLQND